MKRVLVTGATGFIGNGLCTRLIADGFEVTAALHRKPGTFLDERIKPVVIGRIDSQTDWTKAIKNIDLIVHLAARVHVMRESGGNPMAAYRAANVDGTAYLAKCAAGEGVRRFVYMSSVKVNGEENGQAYTETTKPCPVDNYGISKLEAEVELADIAGKSSMEYVIIRPPLVYGPGVKANFLALLKLVDCGFPLPFASVTNRRSFIYLDNLIDCVLNCLVQPAAAGQTYLVSDGQDLSTPELIRMIAASLDRRANLFPFPPALLQSAGRLLGRAETVNRLLGSLTVDMSRIKNETGWTPPFSPQTGLLNTVKWFKEGSAK